MEVVGKIKVIGTENQVSATFKKRELVVVTDEQYPQPILIEFAQDKCSILDKYSVGQNVTVGINLRGREWVNPQGETKYFNQIQGWNIKATEQVPVISAVANTQTFAPAPPLEEPADDLPF
jgi:hypothetical protein